MRHIEHCEWPKNPARTAPSIRHGSPGHGVILLILDLDRPGAGFIEVSQQPMIDAVASIASYSD
jgi:hypothetical protein